MKSFLKIIIPEPLLLELFHKQIFNLMKFKGQTDKWGILFFQYLTNHFILLNLPT
jgi:hypothetical protein